MLSKVIQKNWETDILGYAQSIYAPQLSEFPAWTVKFEGCYGVAIPSAPDCEINENFAGAHITNMVIHPNNSNPVYSIVLTASSEAIRRPFSLLCEALIEPGNNGDLRSNISTNPISWWKEWKELLGNRNIDESTYDTLGELCALKWLVISGKDAVWNGPSGATYDLEVEDMFVEVKSTIARDKREITISNHFQLDPPGKELKLVLCQFEESVFNGVSIDGIMDSFFSMGYNTALIEEKLEAKGFAKGKSSRRRRFILHDMLLYKVDEHFPRITPEMFIGGVMPSGITKISYTVDLGGLTPESIAQGVADEI